MHPATPPFWAVMVQGLWQVSEDVTVFQGGFENILCHLGNLFFDGALSWVNVSEVLWWVSKDCSLPIRGDWVQLKFCWWEYCSGRRCWCWFIYPACGSWRILHSKISAVFWGATIVSPCLWSVQEGREYLWPIDREVVLCLRSRVSTTP